MERGEEHKEKKLDIPENAPDREEYIMGIGKKELVIILIAILVAIILIFSFLSTGRNMFTALMIAGLECTITILAVRRDAINESLIDKLMLIRRYCKIQKKYLYKHYDFFETEEEKN